MQNGADVAVAVKNSSSGSLLLCAGTIRHWSSEEKTSQDKPK
jgi:hypothetical protein